MMAPVFPGTEGWKTVRVAIRGWGPTLRLISLLVVATACAIALLLAA